MEITRAKAEELFPAAVQAHLAVLKQDCEELGLEESDFEESWKLVDGNLYLWSGQDGFGCWNRWTGSAWEEAVRPSDV